MSKNIQANLKPETVERIAEIAERPVTRGIDKMINECLDKLENNPCNSPEIPKGENEDE